MSLPKKSSPLLCQTITKNQNAHCSPLTVPKSSTPLHAKHTYKVLGEGSVGTQRDFKPFGDSGKFNGVTIFYALRIWLLSILKLINDSCDAKKSEVDYEEEEHRFKELERKLANRESARRSRLRKQFELETLRLKVDSLTDENKKLRDEVKRLSEKFDKLVFESLLSKGELGNLLEPEED